ncbi:MAG: L-aspartate oxidase [Pseudomonadota bacterium]
MNSTSKTHTHDVLVIGSGAAGLSLALRLAGSLRVAVMAKGPLTESATRYAQGGISAVLDKQDSLDAHVQDTLQAGAGLCAEDVVRFTVEHAQEAIQWLITQGVPFTREASPTTEHVFHLTREGGHSHRRILHADDSTGRAIELTLESQARQHANLDLYEHYIAIDLITTHKLVLADRRCIGAYALNRTLNRVEAFRARFVILATGGANKVYLYTTNPDVATGDGIAMAWRAGCRVANLEFIQFHPTCLYHPMAKSFLISEAVRGEGGRLLLPDGRPFMQRFDPRGELAPRDIVARAIDSEMKRLGVDCVYLDISHKPAEFITRHFPTIYRRCLELGLDMTKQPLPVVPAAHYTSGGVVTDLRGRTDINGLYAIGEVACTGLHGANRLASNSLLECVVFAFAAGRDILQVQHALPAPPPVPAWDESRVTDSDEEIVVAHNWDELRRMMWDYVGIVRTNKRLERAKRRVDMLKSEISDYYGNFRVTNDLIELRNLALVAELIILSAMQRKESRGLHYTSDYPHTLPEAKNTVLTPTAD